MQLVKKKKNGSFSKYLQSFYNNYLIRLVFLVLCMTNKYVKNSNPKPNDDRYVKKFKRGIATQNMRTNIQEEV